MTKAEATNDATQAWDEHYASDDRVWSGHPNQSLVDVVGGFNPGWVLDLGCGEGGDALWFAHRGWQVTGVDIAPTAVHRAEAAAANAGLPSDMFRWITTDLATWAVGNGADLGSDYDLVSACFLQSWLEFPRTAILRQAASLVAPGGHLVIVSHAEPPPWADVPDEHDHLFWTPDEEVEALVLPDEDWEVLIAEPRSREVTDPSGELATLVDGVVLYRRR